VKPIKAEQVRLTAAIEHVHHEMDATYGRRRMLSEVRELGLNVGRYKVRQLMRQLKLVAKRPRVYSLRETTSYYYWNSIVGVEAFILR
jgi:putative transposase